MNLFLPTIISLLLLSATAFQRPVLVPQKDTNLKLCITCASLTHRNNDKSPRLCSGTRLGVGDARGDYYGESGGSYMVKEFNTMEQLEEIVKLSAQGLPERPDGIVTVAKFTSASSVDARATEAEFERLARSNPASLFLRAFQEYDNASLLFSTAEVTVVPTYDIFYGGNRVARVEGSNQAEVNEIVQRYQFQNSKLDLFSESSDKPWGQDKARDPMKTPRTTARFIAGYDWNSAKGFFDEAADKAQSDWEDQYENSWLPKVDD